MKKYLFIAYSLFVLLHGTYAQNTFPSSGNVGIGTSTPSAAWFSDQYLEINGIRPTLSLNSTGGISTIQWLGSNNSQLALNYYGNSENGLGLYSYTASKEIFMILGNGNVGIGVSNPAATLQVVRGTAPGGTAVFHGSQRTSHFSYSTDEHTYIRGGKTDSNVFINDDGGSVGIGTNDPGTAKLAVSGTIASTEVKVEINPGQGPDYVFEDNYELISLDETKAYISENKHLPEIASAATMEKEGIELGDMNMKLLKKIEELTLYLIDQDEQIQELKRGLAELKKN